MSEYLSKKALLEHIRREIGITERQLDAVMTRHMKEFHGGAIRALQNLEHAIQSGAFDADDSEVQRLRAALKQLIEDYKRRIRSAITMIDDPEVRVEQKTRIHVKKATYQTFINEIEGIMNDEALSTTTEPTNKYFGAEWPKAEGDGNDAN